MKKTLISRINPPTLETFRCLYVRKWYYLSSLDIVFRQISTLVEDSVAHKLRPQNLLKFMMIFVEKQNLGTYFCKTPQLILSIVVNVCFLKLINFRALDSSKIENW